MKRAVSAALLLLLAPGAFGALLFGNLMQQYFLNGIGRVQNAATNGFSNAFNANGTLARMLWR